MAVPDFSGPRLKIARADVQRECLRKELVAFAEAHPGTIYAEVDPKDRDAVIFFADVPEPIPTNLAVVVGEIVHDLRSALDQTVYQLSLRRTKRPGRKTGFPIFVDPNLYQTEGLPQVVSLRDDEKAIIEALQPYHAGKNAKAETLAILSDLNNTDKHRIIPILRAVDSLNSFNMNKLEGEIESVTFHAIGNGVVKHNRTPVFWLRFNTTEGQTAHMEVQPFRGTKVLFGEGSTRARGLSVPDMLTEFITVIRGIIDSLDR